MKLCKKCSQIIPTTIIIDNKKKNLQKRKYCLNCSPFGLHNTRQIKRSNNFIGSIKICPQCNKEFQWNGHGRKCNSCYANTKRFLIKEKALEYKGNKCERCGYDKCKRALSFHHKNPDEKDFIISGNHTRNWNIIQMELDKCMLVCSNCHMEIHEELNKNSK